LYTQVHAGIAKPFESLTLQSSLGCSSLVKILLSLTLSVFTALPTRFTTQRRCHTYPPMASSASKKLPVLLLLPSRPQNWSETIKRHANEHVSRVANLLHEICRTITGATQWICLTTLHIWATILTHMVYIPQVLLAEVLQPVLPGIAAKGTLITNDIGLLRSLSLTCTQDVWRSSGSRYLWWSGIFLRECCRRRMWSRFMPVYYAFF
jgi:hypothetical protein